MRLEFTPKMGRSRSRPSTIQRTVICGAVSIEVSDNGLELQPSDMNKVFEPYFTTKTKSSIASGDGLGLPITYQHVQDHTGTIELKSKSE